MKLFMKKVLTVVLSVMRLVVFMPTSAFAAGTNDDGGSNGNVNNIGAECTQKADIQNNN